MCFLWYSFVLSWSTGFPKNLLLDFHLFVSLLLICWKCAGKIKSRQQWDKRVKATFLGHPVCHKDWIVCLLTPHRMSSVITWEHYCLQQTSNFLIALHYTCLQRASDVFTTGKVKRKKSSRKISHGLFHPRFLPFQKYNIRSFSAKIRVEF